MIDHSRLRIIASRPASELPGGGRRLEVALDALRSFIRGEAGAVFGLDFPFGLPRAIVAEATWREFVLAFNERYRSAEEFRQACQGLSGRELRRATDREARAPWAAWNWRLYRQTFYGIGQVLAPLVKAARVRVLPMDSADRGKTWLLEICPASTLRRLETGGFHYKGQKPENRAARKHVLDRLVGHRALAVDPGLIKRAIEDPGGDAVDSIIAAFAVFDTIVRRRLVPDGAYDPLEGFVYF